jgi:hypothetical protein
MGILLGVGIPLLVGIGFIGYRKYRSRKKDLTIPAVQPPAGEDTRLVTSTSVHVPVHTAASGYHGKASDDLLRSLVGPVDVFAAESFPPWQDITKQHALFRTVARNSVIPDLRSKEIDDADILDGMLTLTTAYWQHAITERSTRILMGEVPLHSGRRDLVLCLRAQPHTLTGWMSRPLWPPQFGSLSEDGYRACQQWLVELALVMWLVLLSPRADYRRPFMDLDWSATSSKMDVLVSRSTKVSALLSRSTNPILVILPALTQRGETASKGWAFGRPVED